MGPSVKYAEFLVENFKVRYAGEFDRIEKVTANGQHTILVKGDEE